MFDGALAFEKGVKFLLKLYPNMIPSKFINFAHTVGIGYCDYLVVAISDIYHMEIVRNS